MLPHDGHFPPVFYRPVCKLLADIYEKFDGCFSVFHRQVMGLLNPCYGMLVCRAAPGSKLYILSLFIFPF